jgi:hypothetical protein
VLLQPSPRNNEKLLDEVFVISRIIKVKVRVISRAEEEIHIANSLITLSTNNDNFVTQNNVWSSEKAVKTI